MVPLAARTLPSPWVVITTTAVQYALLWLEREQKTRDGILKCGHLSPLSLWREQSSSGGGYCTRGYRLLMTGLPLPRLYPFSSLSLSLSLDGHMSHLQTSPGTSYLG